MEYAKVLDNIHIIPCMHEGKMRTEQEIAMMVEEELLRTGIL